MAIPAAPINVATYKFNSMYFVLHKTFFAEKTGGREGVEKDKWILAGKSVGDKERRKTERKGKKEYIFHI